MFQNDLPFIKSKDHHNYIAFFLTLACNLKCSYCINLHDGGSRNSKAKRKNLTIDEWIAVANRLILRDDLPLTLQGGEPTLLKGFYRFVNEVKPEIKMDLITNLKFDVDKFIANVPTWRFLREAPYAPIRVSYHPGQNHIEEIIPNVNKLKNAGFKVGIWGIEHPDLKIKKHIFEVKEQCLKEGIDFRTKEYLGEFNGELFGTFKYSNSVSSKKMLNCKCRTTELIVDPGGYIYKCHSDLYAGRDPYAHILDDLFNENDIDIFRNCDFYGDCNPCDVKVKTNRLQQYGHTSVEIIDIKRD